jgi:hypothetical protein
MEGSLSMIERDFYRISDLSKAYEEWQVSNYNDAQPQTRVQIWQATFMLAIAQQLSVIASHLGKIVRKAEQQNDEN